MKKTVSILIAIVACAAFVYGDAYEQMKTYQFGQDRAFITAVGKEASAATPKHRLVIEEKLMGVLTAPNATVAGKHHACRILTRIGTKQSVPVLATLLANDESAHMALYAMCAIDDPSVNATLRTALDNVSGPTRITIINLLGERGDRQAVPILAKLAADRNADTAEAALTALGGIGNKQAFQALEIAIIPPALSGSRDNALLRCAEKMKPAQALKVYKRLATDGASQPIRIAALRGQAIADPDTASALIVGLLNRNDIGLRNLGCCLATEIKDPGLTPALTAALPALAPDAQTALLHVLGARGDRSAAGAVGALTKSPDATVRTASLKALGAIGTAKAIAPLVAALATDTASRDAAMEGLTRISAPGVDDAILLRLRTGGKDTKIALCKCAIDRNMKPAVPSLLELALGDDAHIVKAALESLAKLAEQKDIPVMVALLPELKSTALQRVAGQSIATAILRQPDKEFASKPLLDAYSHADAQSKSALIGTMGQVGGSAALKKVVAELDNSDAQLKDAAVRAMASWPDASALDLQYNLARNAENQTHRVLALRGYVRSIGASELKSSEKMKLYQKAMAAAVRPEDKKSVLSGLGSQKNGAALELASTYLNDAQLKKEAASAVFSIYRNLGTSQREQAKPVLLDIIDNSENDKLVSGAKKALASKPKKKK